MMCCVIYASKCGVPYQKLCEDLKKVYERLLLIEHDNNPLTERDMKSALKIYRRDFYNITLADIERMTGLRLPRNKRNGRTREKRLQGARAIRDINNENWRKGNGRPKGSGTAQARVIEWRQQHPDGRKIDCERETGLSRHIVLKWW